MNSKPNAIVAQSGGPTAVINSSACGVIQESLKSGKIGRVIGATNGILGVLSEDLFDISAEKPDAIEQLTQTPAAAAATTGLAHRSDEDAPHLIYMPESAAAFALDFHAIPHRGQNTAHST